jgi:hypothetical protein
VSARASWLKAWGDLISLAGAAVAEEGARGGGSTMKYRNRTSRPMAAVVGDGLGSSPASPESWPGEGSMTSGVPNNA